MAAIGMKGGLEAQAKCDSLSLAVLWESGKMLVVARSAGTDPGHLPAEIVT
jgi:hypothetical protein